MSGNTDNNQIEVEELSSEEEYTSEWDALVGKLAESRKQINDILK